MRVTLSIATMGRTGLSRALSTAIASCSTDIELDVAIADDSLDGRAARAVSNTARGALSIKIIPVASGNIARARNACLDAANGEFIAFIDDDEWADRDWLPSLAVAIRQFDADAVFGRVVPIYPVGTPRWIIEAGSLRRRVLPEGHQLKTGSTSNVLFSRSALLDRGIRFSEDLGNTGGEDTELFGKLHRLGGKLVASPDAVVYEEVAADRLTKDYLRIRGRRAGQSYAQLHMIGRGTFSRRRFYFGTLCKAGLCMCIFLVLRPVARGLSFFYELKYWKYCGMLRQWRNKQMPMLYDPNPVTP